MNFIILEENLAFSFQAQVITETYFPGITRNIYLKAWRYNLHLAEKCMLIELGAEDFIEDEDLYAIRTPSKDLMRIRDSMEAIGCLIKAAEVEMVPKSFQKLNQIDYDLTVRLLNCLEDNDDVNKVYTNLYWS